MSAHPGTTATTTVMETAAVMMEHADNKNMDMEEFDMDMDVDPEMYLRGRGYPPPMTAVSADRIESAVKSAISSLPNMERGNLTVKVVINTGNNVMNF